MEQFLTDLPKLRKSLWSLHAPRFQIRNYLMYDPGTAVMVYRGYCSGVFSGALKIYQFGPQTAHLIGLYPYQAEAIIAASDNEPGHDPELRRRIMLALGFQV